MRVSARCVPACWIAVMLVLGGCSRDAPPTDLGAMELVIDSHASPVVRPLSASEQDRVSAWIQNEQSEWAQRDHYFADKGPVWIRGGKWELFIADGTAVLCGHPGCWERSSSVSALTELLEE
jgi:hypothetical protein